MPPITQYGSFTKQIADQINANINAAGLAFLNGNIIMLDPFAGVDTNDGITAPVNTLGRAYGIGREGKNDVIALISNGLTTSTARVNTAFVWAKNALHLVGVSCGVNLSNRARIAPSTSATAFANFLTVSGSGCLFSNIELFAGFTTGTTAAIALTVTGGRNLFYNSHITGMADAASAADAGSRHVKISGTGENQFVNCTIGSDTIARTNANASIGLAGGTARNEFRNCVFPFYSGDGNSLGIIVPAAGMDRFQLFDKCIFINAIKSGATAMTAFGAITAQTSPAGMLVYRDCGMVGITANEGTTKTAAYVIGPAVSSSMGIGVNPA
jgi:hypothetical protein